MAGGQADVRTAALLTRTHESAEPFAALDREPPVYFVAMGSPLAAAPGQ